jgi:hypothetical protein
MSKTTILKPLNKIKTYLLAKPFVFENIKELKTNENTRFSEFLIYYILIKKHTY